MKYILLIFSLLTTIITTDAKGLQFDNTKIDFGTIAEDGGKIERTFTFRNTSNNPIVIQRAQVTCGCTMPEFSKVPIMPRENGTVKVTFDPMWRAGRNIRDIYLYTSASKDPIVLRLTGNVTARVVPIEERFPYKLEQHEDAVRIETTNYDFRALYRGETTQAVITIYNPSKKGVQIEFRNRNPNSIMQSYYSREIAAGAESMVEVAYPLEQDYTTAGRLYDTLDIFIDGRRSQHALTISGLAVEK